MAAGGAVLSHLASPLLWLVVHAVVGLLQIQIIPELNRHLPT
jgi:hypothetical protein